MRYTNSLIKRIVALALALVIILGTMPTNGVVVLAASDFQSGITPGLGGGNRITDDDYTCNNLFTYDGQPHGLEVIAPGFTVEFKDAEGNWVSESPTYVDAGYYLIQFRVSAPGYRTLEKASQVLNIMPAKITGIGVSGMETVYDGSAVKLVTVAGTQEGDVVTYQIAGDETVYTEAPSATNAGVYEVTVTVERDANYKVFTETVTSEIKKADITGINLSGDTLGYNNKEQALVSLEGSLEETDKVTWTVNEETVEGKDIPTKMALGEYNVSVTINRGDNYNELTLTAKTYIVKGELDLEGLTVKGLEGVYTGKNQAAVSVTNQGEYTLQYKLGDGEWSDTIPTVMEVGSYTIWVKAVKNNYNDKDVVVEPAASAVAPYNVYIAKAKQNIKFTKEPLEEKLVYHPDAKELPGVTGQYTGAKLNYEISKGTDVAMIEEGKLKLLKGGEFVLTVYASGNDSYEKSNTLSWTVNVEKAEQSFTFEHDKQIKEIYGLASFDTKIKCSELNSGVVTYAVSQNTIGAAVNDDIGVVSFSDSTEKVGTVTIIVVLEEDECYKRFEDTYTITLEYEAVPEKPYTLFGDKTIQDSEWFTGDVTILAPNGYQISYKNDLTDNAWANSVVWKLDGYEGTWEENAAPVVYLKKIDTGMITGAIPVSDLKKDTGSPSGLAISYETKVLDTINDKLFGFSASAVKVTVTANDSLSGIGKMEYSKHGGNDYVTISENNGKYEFDVESQYRGQLWIRVTDVAGNVEVYKHLQDGKDKILVVDSSVPGLLVGYTGTLDDKAVDGIRYVKGEQVTIEVMVQDENLDLRAADPVVTVNDGNTKEEITGWVFDATSGKLTFELGDAGDYIIKAQFKDRLDREVTYQSEVRIDRKAPVIASDIEQKKYYTENKTFTLKITEHNFDATKVELKIGATDSKGKDVLTKAEIEKFAADIKDPAKWHPTGDPDTYEFALPIEKDGNYELTVSCEDILGWSADQHERSFTLDKEDPIKPTLTYEVGTEKSDLTVADVILNALGLKKLFGFAKETTVVTVQVDDATSGVAYLLYKIHEEDEFKKVEVDAEGKYTFNLDPQYRGRITVEVYDKAGRSTPVVEEKEIVVDNIAPKVEIEFTGDRQSAVKKDGDTISRDTMEVYDDTTRFIYNGDVTATIKVKEDNFFPADDNMTVIITCDGVEVENWAAAGITDTGWSVVDGVYTRSFVMTKDGDYKLYATYQDYSENQMEWESKEYEKTGDYKYESNIHTIDTTHPIYEVSYNNNEVIQTIENRAYYAAARTATIKITDRNFRPDDVKFDVSHANIGAGDAFTYSKLISWSDWTKSGDTWTAIVPFAADANYTIRLDYADLANNGMVKIVSEKEMEGSYYSEFTVDTTDPINLGVEYRSKENKITNKILNAITFGNYTAGQEVVLTMADTTAGIDYIELTITPEGPASATSLIMPNKLQINANGKVIDGGKGFIGEVKSQGDEHSLTLSFDVPAQFRGKVDFVAYDKSGNFSNSYEDPGVLVVDTVAPRREVFYEPVRIIDAKSEVDLREEEFSEGVNAKLYFNAPSKVIFQITEENFDLYKDENVLPLVMVDNLLDSDPAFDLENLKWTKVEIEGKSDVWQAEHTFDKQGDYKITMAYTDLTTNKMVEYESCPLYVDNTPGKIDLTFYEGDPLTKREPVQNIDGVDYYKTVQTVVVQITEHNFRANDVDLKVTSHNLEKTELVELEEYTTYAKNPNNWTQNGDVWTLDTEGMVFDEEAIYRIEVNYTDLAKNDSDTKSVDFVYDKTADNKDIKIEYSTEILNEVLNKLSFGLFQENVRVDITVKDVTSGVESIVLSYTPDENAPSSNNGENTERYSKVLEVTGNGSVFTATYTIPAQARGSVQVDVLDRCHNGSSTMDLDKPTLVVDNDKPIGEVQYNAPVQTVDGVSYYAGDIHATFRITEPNFDLTMLDEANWPRITVNGTPIRVTWHKNVADAWEARYTISQDGDYVITMDYTDPSGNSMGNNGAEPAYTSNQLTLDTTAPTIKVSNIKANSANKDETYGFVIEMSDINLDVASMKPVLKAVVQENGAYKTKEIDLGTATTVVAGQTYTYTVEDLPEDGLYTLTCEVKDMAANTTNEIELEDTKLYEQVQFSINRKGSAFGYGNTFTENLNSQYYVYSVDEDVVLVEVNVDPIENYTVKLNGKELTEKTDYVTDQTSNAGEWSKRTYRINKSLFEAEGEYNIIITSTDKATTTAYSDIKNLTMSFVVDQTKPVLTITGLTTGGRYQTDAQTVTLIPTDEGGRLKSLKVTVLDSNGQPLTDDTDTDISVRFEMSGDEMLQFLAENDGKITFTIPEGLNNQVRIVCTDCAVNAENETNAYDELFTRVTVSQNQFIIFYANKTAFYGTIAGVLAAVALIVVLLNRKKKSKA